MKWNVYRFDMNKKTMEIFNVFNHSSFYNEVMELDPYDSEFANELRKCTQYYFWSKTEYEIILSPWPSIRETIEEKVDIYNQLRLNWEHFVNYVAQELKKLKVPQMKWYVFSGNGEPLCWDHKILEFDNEEAAKNYLNDIQIFSKEAEKFAAAEVKETLLLNDGSHINATNKRLYACLGGSDLEMEEI